MASFAAGFVEPEAPVPETKGKPRAKLQHLRNYRECQELEPDRRGTPGRVVVLGFTRMVWKRCAGSEFYELESEG
jgi:hypothetical protein